MVYRFATYLALCCWLPFWAIAQQVETVRLKTVPGPYLRFDQFTVNNEAFKQAYNKQMVLHDSRGYLWFISEPNAHEQLIRYDGTYAKSFGTEDWQFIKENEFHEIWAINKRGLCRFDPVTETFHYFRNPLIKRIWIGSWAMGKAGKNWFWWPENRPVRPASIPFVEFDTQTNKVRQINPTSLINGYTGQTEAEKPFTFMPRTTDAAGRVWGHAESHSSHTVGYYDAKRNALVWYPMSGFMNSEVDKNGKPDQKLDAINVIEADGKYIWMGGWSHTGLFRLDTQTRHWKQFYFPNLAYNRIFRIIRRNDHQFWLQTAGAPVLFDKTTETLYTYPHEPDNVFTPASGENPYVAGKNQSLWLGLADRNNTATVNVLHESKQALRIKDDTLLHYLTEFRPLYKKGRKLYFTYHTDASVNFAEYDEVYKTVIILYRLPFNGFTEQAFYAALRDSVNQTVWLAGTSAIGAIFRFDEKRRLVIPVRATIQGLPPGENQTENYNQIMAIVQDKAGNVWFPSFGAAGKYSGNLLQFNSRTKQFSGFRAGTHGLLNNQIRTAIVDSKGLLWLGYWGLGAILQVDPTTHQATVKLPDSESAKVMKMVDDTARHMIWIARLENGLWQYDRRKNTSRQLLTEPVLSVHLTKSKVLWLKTLTGLVRFVPETGQQMRFGSEYDLHSFNWSPFVKSNDDEFFFEKFHFFDQDIKSDTTKPKLVFSFLKVFDRELQLPHTLNDTKFIDLNYDQNFFTVGFSVLSYFQSERNQYAYRLVGFNKDWVNVGNKPLAVFSNVPPSTYQLQIKGSNNDGIWSEVKTISIHIIPPFWQTWWFRALAFALLLLVVIILYRFQVERRTLKARLETEEAKRRQTEAELNEKEAAFQLKISQTEMAALRSQMNPHFIFNCLNSIQFFTARNDAEKASDYLTKFSRLIRLVLENSKSERVTLANELETLRLYIEMEAMRFQQKVSYEIQVADEIDTGSIHIPPLLLQPFVENAIWHGLMHKEEGGTVQINVQQTQDNLLHVEIIDDGVGRRQAADYKSKSATQNKSFGMKLTAERIELINQLYHTKTQVDVVDLVDENGKAKGTKVTIDIPIQ